MYTSSTTLTVPVNADGFFNYLEAISFNIHCWYWYYILPMEKRYGVRDWYLKPWCSNIYSILQYQCHILQTLPFITKKKIFPKEESNKDGLSLALLEVSRKYPECIQEVSKQFF